MSLVNRQEEKLCLQKEYLQKKHNLAIWKTIAKYLISENKVEKNLLKIKDDLYAERFRHTSWWPCPLDVGLYLEVYKGEKLTILLKWTFLWFAYLNALLMNVRLLCRNITIGVVRKWL